MTQTRSGKSSIPNVLTALNIVLGVSAILLAIHGAKTDYAHGLYFVGAAWLVVVSTVLDGLDGTLARKLGSTGALGQQLDSLADLTVFGIAPATLLYARFFDSLSPWTAPVPVAFVLASAFRLARFNARDVPAGRKHFEGLPTTTSGGALGAYVLSVEFMQRHGSGDSDNHLWFAFGAGLLALVHALLMISTIPFAPFSRFFFRNFGRAGRVAVCVMVLAALACCPAFTLLGLALIYDIESAAKWGIRKLSGAG